MKSAYKLWRIQLSWWSARCVRKLLNRNFAFRKYDCAVPVVLLLLYFMWLWKFEKNFGWKMGQYANFRSILGLYRPWSKRYVFVMMLIYSFSSACVMLWFIVGILFMVYRLASNLSWWTCPPIFLSASYAIFDTCEMLTTSFANGTV